MIRFHPLAGTLEGEGVARVVRSAADLRGYWAEPDAATDAPLYETYAWNHSAAEGALLWGSTILHPGRIGEEWAMTRGHRHLDPTKGELVLTVSGTGWVVLKDDAGVETRERMEPGSVHHIDGRLAHRTVNDGEEPLVFWTAWDAGCGHDYETVLPWPGLKGA
jgi:glucose-6-phosphate isomerase, archaeal